MNWNDFYDLFWSVPYWLRIIILMIVGPIINYLGLRQIGLDLSLDVVLLGSWLFTWIIVLINVRWNDDREEGESKDE